MNSNTTPATFVAPNSVAALKRYLKLGVTIYYRKNYAGGVEPNLQWRTVDKVQTNAVAFAVPTSSQLSWFRFDVPARDFTFTDDGFEVARDKMTPLVYSYFAPDTQSK